MADPITYEALFDILRKESSREDLQVLQETFYSDAKAFMQEKKAGIGQDGAQGHKAAIEFQNIQKILKELYERRERKLLLLALNKARTESAIIDPSILLPQEKELFDLLVRELQQKKRSILGGVETPPPSTSLPEPAQETPSLVSKPSLEPTSQQEETSPSVLKIEFLSAIPKFLGRDRSIFGPYEAGESAELPADIASVLVKKGRAKEC